MRRVLMIAVLFGLAACTQPASEPVSEETAAVQSTAPIQAGVYVFDSDPGAMVACIMKLDDNVVEDAPGFHSVWLGPGCESNFPILAVLTGWAERDGDSFTLIAAEGSEFGTFTRSEDGLLRATSLNDGKTYTMMMGE